MEKKTSFKKTTFLDLIQLYRKDPTVFKKKNTQLTKSLLKGFRKKNPLELLSHACRFWAYDHPENQEVLVFFQSLIMGHPFPRTPSSLNKSESYGIMAEVKKLYLHTYIPELCDFFPNLDDRCLEGLLRAYLAHTKKKNSLDFVKVSHALAPFFIPKRCQRSLDSFRELALQCEKQKKIMEKERKGSLLDPDLFSLQNNKKLNKKFIKSLSLCFGKNPKFFEKEGDQRDSLIPKYPFVEYKGTGYCFLPFKLHLNCLGYLSQHLFDAQDTHCFEELYLKGEIYKGLRDIFGKACLYHNVFLCRESANPFDEEALEAVDFLVVFDQIILVFSLQKEFSISCEGAGLPFAFKPAFETKVYAPMERSQKIRSLFFQKERMHILDAKKKVVGKLNPSEIRNSYGIGISLDALGSLFPLLDKLLEKDKRLVWDNACLFSLEDFQMLCEHISTPSLWILYLERRTNLGEGRSLGSFISEAALLGNFLDNQLNELRVDKFLDYDETIDRFYSQKKRDWDQLGHLDPEFREFLHCVEGAKSSGTLSVTRFLHSLDLSLQKRLIGMLKEERANFFTDGKDHGFSRFYSDLSVGLTVFCAKESTLSFFWEKMYSYVCSKMKQTDAHTWILIVEVISQQGGITYEHKLYKGLEKDQSNHLGFSS